MVESVATTESRRGACVHCGDPLTGVHFCAGCGKIQPLAPGTDYFAFFGLPRKLVVNEPELEKAFYSLSREFHPDYFMSASAAERSASTERSSMLNDAHRTLRNPVARAQYLLSLEGYKEAEKKAPPDLLEEVFDLNMQIEEIKGARKMGDEEEISGAKRALEEAMQGLNERLAGIDRRLFTLAGEWDAVLDRGRIEEERRSTLDRISELLSHRSYIRNLAQDIREEL